VGAVPAAVLEAARGASEARAGAELARRASDARERLRAHVQAEEERLVSAGFASGAPRAAVEEALATLRRHRDAVEAALGAARLELDAAALVLPA
jgi:ATP-dependent helicase HepA